MGSMEQPLHVVGAILLKGDRILVARRASHKGAAGLWEFPGGKVDPGELPAEALAREIREELDLRINVVKTFDISNTIVGGRLIRLEVMVCHVMGDFAGVSSDHDAFLWATTGDMGSLEWATPDLPAVRKLGTFADFSLVAI